jgi:hypothetical protein
MRCRQFSLIAACLLLGGVGCAGRHSIVAATGTNIGVEISENPQTQAPYAKLGYQRTEWAIVPTNRSATEEPGDKGNGAKDHGEVLMELRYGGIFDTGPSSGIYQRLAVGGTAVSQPGASLMFARNAAGDVDVAAVNALQSVRTIPDAGPDIASDQEEIARKRQCKAGNAAAVDAAVVAVGPWSTYDDFRDRNPMPTKAQTEQILNKLSAVTCI